MVAAAVAAECQAESVVARALIATATRCSWSWMLAAIEIPARIGFKRQIHHGVLTTDAVGSVLRLRMFLAVERSVAIWLEWNFDCV